MTDFRPIFTRLGLQQYIQCFAEEGFENWETILEITESDLDALKVKLGHRRILQREIASVRGPRIEQWAAISSPSRSQASYDSGQGAVEDISDLAVHDPLAVPRKKRRYRRHPKPDDNAPERPPSAYVVFSNKIREELKSQNLSFTEIAKRVGESWQSLSSQEKEPYETRASNAKEKYHKDMAGYKATDAYRDYQRYLVDFKSKYGSRSDENHPKLEHEQSNASSASFGSGPEGHESLIGDSDPSYTRIDAAGTTISPAGSDTRRSLGLPLSRPSSVSTLSLGQDLSASVSPPAQPFGSATDMQPSTRQGQIGSSLSSASRQVNLHPSTHEYHAPSLSSSMNLPHGPTYPHPRRKPMGAVERIPTFGREESSRSSVTSSQSSISTAATSRSTLRGSEDESNSHVTLPPISALADLTREGHKMEYYSTHKNSNSPQGLRPLGYSSPRQFVPNLPGSSESSHAQSHRSEHSFPINRPESTSLGPIGRQATHLPHLSRTSSTAEDEGSPAHPDPLSVLADAAQNGHDARCHPER